MPQTYQTTSLSSSKAFPIRHFFEFNHNLFYVNIFTSLVFVAISLFDGQLVRASMVLDLR
jgi:hypothetical protein